VHPNHVTTAGMVVGVVAAGLYATGAARAADWGAGFYVLSCILDHVDGELARLSGRCSPRGRAYDRVADLVVRFALFSGMGFGLRHGALGAAAVVLGLVAGGALVVIFAARSAIGREYGWNALTQPSAGGWDLEDILYVIAPVTWLGWLAPFMVAVGIGAPLFALWILRSRRVRRTPPAVVHAVLDSSLASD
jgi:phosphatidylglycerophosphate synthase